ncbi:MAG: hypothetical protein ABIO93_21555 [Dyadobacter sp.]
MKYIGIGFLIGVVGYVLAAFLSYYLIGKFSSNVTTGASRPA